MVSIILGAIDRDASGLAPLDIKSHKSVPLFGNSARAIEIYERRNQHRSGLGLDPFGHGQPRFQIRFAFDNPSPVFLDRQPLDG